MSVREVASRANKLGLCVVPVREDGSKAPDVRSWTELQKRRPTDAELKQWFPAEPDRAGLGFICGKVSGGLELFEFDDPKAVVAFKQLADVAGLGPMWRRLELGYSEETPGRGVHWLYRTPEPLGNTKLASKPCEGCEKHEAGQAHVLIESRGEGGFVVVAPSSGSVHATGRPYVLRAGGLETIPVLTTEERDELWALARSLDEMPRHEETGSRPASLPVSGDGDRPGDRFAAQTPWRQILEPHGWTYLWTHGALEYWRRPGKKGRFASATTGPRGGDLGADYLYVFSTSTEFDAERAYNKFSAFALLNHQSDYGAAARDLKAQGFGGYDPGPLVAAGGESRFGNASDGAGSSVSLPAATNGSGSHIEPYSFKHVFPEGHFVRRYVEWASELVDAAWEYHEAAALLLLAAATPSVKAPLTAHPQGLGTNLYMLIVGDSTSSRKSTAIGFAIALLEECMPGTAIADRASPEGLIQDLAVRNRKAAVWFPDEFSDHLERIKRRDPDMIEILLSLYGGKGYTKRRANKRIKGQVEVMQDIDRVVDPRLSILAASTPAIFATLSNQDVERGLLPRFGMVMPRGKPQRMPIRRLTEREDEKREILRSYLAQLAYWSERHGEENGIEAWFSDDALAVLDAYEVEVESQSETIIKRLPVMAYKLAMLAAAGEEVPHVAKLVVEQRDAECGVAIARIWRRSGLDFLDNIGGRNEREQRMQQVIEKAMRYLRAHAGRASRTEIANHVNVLARDLTDVQDTLCDQGRIWLEHGTPTTKGGRPPTFWRLPEHEVVRRLTTVARPDAVEREHDAQ